MKRSFRWHHEVYYSLAILSTVQYVLVGVEQYSTVRISWCRTEQYSTVQYSTVRTSWCRTVQYSTVRTSWCRTVHRLLQQKEMKNTEFVKKKRAH